MSSASHHQPAPVNTVPFFTRGVFIMLAIIAVGAAFGLYRFIFGIGAATNLTDQYPWGLWIGVDVATGVALAAGGFTTSALAHIFHRDKYHAIVRPALLTAMLGYTFVGIGLMFDLGRFYNIWHPMIYWQGNSVLFEVGMCVMAYLTVLYLEFLPIVIERFKDGVHLPGPLAIFNKPAEMFFGISEKVLNRILFILIILGVVLSCMHQSSLGTLLVIAPTKEHPLWWTPIMPMLFLASAIMVGFPMVVVESIAAHKSFKLKPEVDLLESLSKVIMVFVGIYFSMKVIDLAIRETYVYLFQPSFETLMFGIEMIGGLVIPFIMLGSKKIRSSPRGLFTAALLIVLGVALNRINVFLVAYRPPYAAGRYFPSAGEFAVTIALILTIMLIYRFVALNFPLIAGEPLDAVDENKAAGGGSRPAGVAASPKAIGTFLLILGIGALTTGCKNGKPGVAPIQPGDRVVASEHAKFDACPPCPCLIAEENIVDDINHKKMENLNADDGPQISILYHLTDMYVPVEFTHSDHVDFADSCEDCHHHGSEVEPTAPCRACHGSSITNLDRPGLKGAYHRQCMNCHRQNGSGPLGCIDCHELRKPGDAEQEKALGALTIENAPETARLDHITDEVGPVSFRHDLHVEITDHCEVCHHHQSEVERTPPCRECHVHKIKEPGDDKLGLKEVYHQLCLNCHRGEGEGPLTCKDCHEPKTKEGKE